MRILIIATIWLLSLGVIAWASSEEDEFEPGPIAVAELFTSQSCSSCPPAEKYFKELALRDDIVVIEWHVDYWDQLVHGRAGAWKDPYSSSANTERQRAYNANIRQTWGAYTPQAVISGEKETVGFKSGQIERWFMTADPLPIKVGVVEEEKNLRIVVAAGSTGNNAQVLRVELLPRQTTSVPRGENHGRTLSSSNIALGVERLGLWGGGQSEYTAEKPKEGHRCAILVQEETDYGPARILGASYCDQ